MKVYVVIKYDSVFDSEEVDSVWSTRSGAETALSAVAGGLRIEDHIIDGGK